MAGGAGCCLEMRGGCFKPSCFLSQVCDFPQHHFAAVIHTPGLPPSPSPTAAALNFPCLLNPKGQGVVVGGGGGKRVMGGVGSVMLTQNTGCKN